jgi:hypothetical protein
MPWGAYALKNTTAGPVPRAWFTRVPPGKYFLSVVAVCDTDSNCLPTGTVDTVAVAYHAESFTYTPEPAPSGGPQPSSTPGPHGGGGSPHGVDAGQVIGAIVGVLAVVALGFGGWFVFRRWRSAVPRDYDSSAPFTSADVEGDYGVLDD